MHGASRILVRLSSFLHAGLKSEAARAGLTLNELCLEALERRMSEPFEPPRPALPLPSLILESSLGARLDGIVLFGSRARGEGKESSDTDLLLCVTPRTQLTRGLYTEWDSFAGAHSEAIPPGLSPHFSRLPATPEEAGSLWLEVAIDGAVLWERDLAVSRFLASVRRYLISGKATRKSSYGVAYWVRNDAESAPR